MSESTSEPWAEQFDILAKGVPLPEANGVQLVCRVDGCDHEERLANFGKVEKCDWTEIGHDEAILTDGATLHQGYCPEHSLDEDELMANPNRNEQPTRARDKEEYAAYDFLKQGESVECTGILLRCECSSCYREESFEFGEAEQQGWASGEMVGSLSNGQVLSEGRCPEHRE